MMLSMMQKWAMSVTPESFKGFIPYASPSSLQVIFPTEVLELALKIAKRSVQGGVSSSELPAHWLERMRGAGIEVVFGSVQGLKVDLLSLEERTEVGEKLLEFYFLSQQLDGPLFLDIRPDQLEWTRETRVLKVKAGGLVHHPSTLFRESVQALYRGFYFDDPAATAQGVQLYAWKNTGNPRLLEKMDQLLKKHFGQGDQDSVRFSISHFKESFHAIFEAAKTEKSKFHPELTFLGVMLVTLYLTLESLDVPLGVRKTYLKTITKQPIF